MNRREAISAVGVLLGGTIIGAEFFLTGCKNSDKKTGAIAFSKEDAAYLDEIAETILPTTASSPGAKAAEVGSFMTVMVTDCYDEEDQQIFLAGMTSLDKSCKQKYSSSFMQTAPEQRHALLVELDKEQVAHQKNKKGDERSHYFRMMKELTLLGYFTSEIGATKALRYMESPGHYDGDLPYKKGDKAWAT